MSYNLIIAKKTRESDYWDIDLYKVISPIHRHRLEILPVVFNLDIDLETKDVDHFIEYLFSNVHYNEGQLDILRNEFPGFDVGTLHQSKISSMEILECLLKNGLLNHDVLNRFLRDQTDEESTNVIDVLIDECSEPIILPDANSYHHVEFIYSLYDPEHPDVFAEGFAICGFDGGPNGIDLDSFDELKKLMKLEDRLRYTDVRRLDLLYNGRVYTDVSMMDCFSTNYPLKVLAERVKITNYKLNVEDCSGFIKALYDEKMFSYEQLVIYMKDPDVYKQYRLNCVYPKYFVL